MSVTIAGPAGLVSVALPLEPTRLPVTSRRDCPFRWTFRPAEEWESRCLRVDIGGAGFDVDITPNRNGETTPDWCPLRIAPVLVALETP